MMYNTVSKLCFAQFEKVKLVEEEFSKFAFWFDKFDYLWPERIMLEIQKLMYKNTWKTRLE